MSKPRLRPDMLLFVLQSALNFHEWRGKCLGLDETVTCNSIFRMLAKVKQGEYHSQPSLISPFAIACATIILAAAYLSNLSDFP